MEKMHLVHYHLFRAIFRRNPQRVVEAIPAHWHPGPPGDLRERFNPKRAVEAIPAVRLDVERQDIHRFNPKRAVGAIPAIERQIISG